MVDTYNDTTTLAEAKDIIDDAHLEIKQLEKDLAESWEKIKQKEEAWKKSNEFLKKEKERTKDFVDAKTFRNSIKNEEEPVTAAAKKFGMVTKAELKSLQDNFEKEKAGAIKQWKDLYDAEKQKNDSHTCSDSKPADLPDNWKTELARISQLEKELALAKVNQAPADLPTDWKTKLAQISQLVKDLAIARANQKPANLPSNWQDYLTRPNIPITEAEWKNDWSKRSKGSTLTSEQSAKLNDYDNLSKVIDNLRAEIKTLSDIFTNHLGFNPSDSNWSVDLINKLGGASLTEIPSSQTLKNLLENPSGNNDSGNSAKRIKDLEEEIVKLNFMFKLTMDQIIGKVGNGSWEKNNAEIERRMKKWEEQRANGIEYNPTLRTYAYIEQKTIGQ